MEKWNCAINNEIEYAYIMSLIGGILFSGISYGLLYVIVFLIIWEVLYFMYLDSNARRWEPIERITVILFAILGFLLGRLLHDDDDHQGECDQFFKDCNHYGKEFGWFS